MEMLNRAIGDADAFTKMLEKATHGRHQPRAAAGPTDPETQAWNEAVDRKKAEKKAAKAKRALSGVPACR